jgi:predicted acylesterase/phospholipase RssA
MARLGSCTLFGMMWRPISIAKEDWALKPRVALALSGGGFRVSLFHLGVLKRLAEVNLLSKVEVASTFREGALLGPFWYCDGSDGLKQAVTQQHLKA